jgi:hypothetical protein
LTREIKETVMRTHPLMAASLARGRRADLYRNAEQAQLVQTARARRLQPTTSRTEASAAPIQAIPAQSRQLSKSRCRFGERRSIRGLRSMHGWIDADG